MGCHAGVAVRVGFVEYIGKAPPTGVVPQREFESSMPRSSRSTNMDIGVCHLTQPGHSTRRQAAIITSRLPGRLVFVAEAALGLTLSHIWCHAAQADVTVTKRRVQPGI